MTTNRRVSNQSSLKYSSAGSNSYRGHEDGEDNDQTELYLQTNIFFEGISVYVCDPEFFKQIRKDFNLLLSKNIATRMNGKQVNLVNGPHVVT